MVMYQENFHGHDWVEEEEYDYREDDDYCPNCDSDGDCPQCNKGKNPICGCPCTWCEGTGICYDCGGHPQ